MADWNVVSETPITKPAATVTANKPQWNVVNQAPKPEEKPGLLSSFMKPIKDIPHEIGEEFRAGKKQAGEAVQKGVQEAKAGKYEGHPGEFLMGGVRQALSPITGLSKAMGKGVETGTGSSVAGKAAEFVTSVVGPGAIAKSFGKVGELMPGLNDSVKKLMDEGIQLTHGQIARSVFKRGEDALRSVPILGNMIDSAQFRSLTDFNRAILNRSLSAVGEKLPPDVKVGPEAYGYMQQTLGKKYDAILPQLTFNPDSQLLMDVNNIGVSKISKLPPERKAQWQAYLDELAGFLKPQKNGKIGMDGPTWKARDEELGHDAQRYIKSGDPDQEKLGEALGQLQAQMREALVRGNPNKAKELNDINAAWAIYKRAEGASIRRVKSNGVFSAADLLADIKRSTPTGSFARGDGLMQDLARAGNEVLPPEVPESGTMTRYLWSDLLRSLPYLAGGEVAGQATGMGHLGAETVGAGTVLGGTMYARPTIRATNKLVRSVPQAASTANQALPILGVPASIVDIYTQGK